MTDYMHKYIKYKNKYVNLVNSQAQTGGQKSNTFIAKNSITSNKVYWIHENGRLPFKVIVSKRGIAVYTYQNEDDFRTGSKRDYTKLVWEIRQFLGYWPGYDITQKIHGNTLLICKELGKYIYIGSANNYGSVIYSFNTSNGDKIYEYASPLGYPDIPYPVAFGELNTYFMIDYKYIDNREIETIIDLKHSDMLYREFYGHIGSKNGKHRKHNIKNKKIFYNMIT